MTANRTVAQGWVPRRHGIPSSYNRGCRCAECRYANANRQRITGNGQRWRDKQLAKRIVVDGVLMAPDRPHGVYGTYSTYGCRCEPCKQANRDYMTAWRNGVGRY